MATKIKDSFENESGIVYCFSRKECEIVVNKLCKGYKISSVFYHAGLKG